MNVTLQHPLCTVVHTGGLTRGGSQMLSENDKIRMGGCGIVAAAEVLIYLCRYHNCDGRELLGDIPFTDPVPMDSYNLLLRKITASYIPLLTRSGVNGLVLTGGLNLIFLKHGFPWHGVWCMGKNSFFDNVAEQLGRDVPVIMSVGPNLPNLWGKNRLDFYTLRQDGQCEKAAAVNSHYVIATGIDDEWIRISSWGRTFYINRKEYSEYIRRYSGSIVCNLLRITKK